MSSLDFYLREFVLSQFLGLHKLELDCLKEKLVDQFLHSKIIKDSQLLRKSEASIHMYIQVSEEEKVDYKKVPTSKIWGLDGRLINGNERREWKCEI